MIAELFDDLEVAHDHMAISCSMLAVLSRSLNDVQLMIILKVSVRPMIQMNALEGFLKKPLMRPKKTDLWDDRSARIRLTIIPNPSSVYSIKEKVNSVMWLLPVTFTYKILKKFTDGTTQRELQEKFLITPKQLVTCITGRRYLGNSNRKMLVKKCSASKGESGP